MKDWPRLVCCAGVLALLGWATATLLREPVLGVADNADFRRVIEPAGLFHADADPRNAEFVTPHYTIGTSNLWSRLSSPALLAWVARAIPLGYQSDILDVRQMGLLCLTLLVLVIAWAWRSGVPPPLVLLVTWVAVDPGYLLFFNGFLADGPLFLAVLGVAVWIGQGSLESAWSAAALLALLLLGGLAKEQYAILPALATLVLVVRFVAARTRPRWRHAALGAALLAVSIGCPLQFAVGNAPAFPVENHYNALFYGELRFASSSRAVLAELGFPDSDHFWVGRNRFERPPPAAVDRRAQTVSRVQLVGLYLRDPAAIGRALAAIAFEFGRTRALGHGNFEKSESPSPHGHDTYAVWWEFSALRSLPLNAFRWLLWVFLGAILVGVGVRVWTRRRLEPLTTSLLFLWLWITVQMGVCIIGEGAFGLERHLVGARFAFDLLLVGAAYGAAAWGRSAARPAVKSRG